MHALCTPPHRTPRSERGLRQWFESGVASLCAATADAQVHKSGGTPLPQGSRLMRDMGTESELSSALLSANGALCAAIGPAGQTGANADSSSRDGLVPEKGQEPIAEKKPEIQVHTRPLLPKISRTAAEAGVGSGPSVRGCRGPTLAGQSVCLLRIRLAARLS